MVIKDAQVIQLVERIGEHYRTNIANHFIRPALNQAPMGKQTWDLVEALTEKIDLNLIQGFHLDELYRQIAAAASFVSVLRHDISPSLRSRVPTGAGPDRVFRDMAVNAFPSNLKVFAELLNELFVCLVQMDKANVKGRQPLYSFMPELKDVTHLLMDP